MPTPEELLQELDLTLTDQGYTVTIDHKLWGLHAQNPRASYLQQMVRIGGRDGTLYWFWEWPGPEDDSPSSYEPFCPAQDVGGMAERLVRVLALADAR